MIYLRLRSKKRLTLLTDGVDFELYPSSGCWINSVDFKNLHQENGNTIFLTNSIGIAPLHVVPSRNRMLFFRLPLESMLVDGMDFNLSSKFTTKDDLTLVRLPLNLGLRSVMVTPELPNCVVFSYVPQIAFENLQLDPMSVIKLSENNFQKEKNDEIVKIISNEAGSVVSGYMVDHKYMIGSYGFTKDDWKWEDHPNKQGHTCTTLSCYSGSAVSAIFFLKSMLKLVIFCNLRFAFRELYNFVNPKKMQKQKTITTLPILSLPPCHYHSVKSISLPAFHKTFQESINEFYIFEYFYELNKFQIKHLLYNQNNQNINNETKSHWKSQLLLKYENLERKLSPFQEVITFHKEMNKFYVIDWLQSIYFSFDKFKNNFNEMPKKFNSKINFSYSFINSTLYLFGGRNLNIKNYKMIQNDVTNDLFKAYPIEQINNLQFKKTLQNECPMPSPRENHSQISVGCFIYIFGGNSLLKEELLNDLYRYNTVTNYWERIEYLNNDYIPPPIKFQYMCSIYQDYFIVMGGLIRTRNLLSENNDIIINDYNTINDCNNNDCKEEDILLSKQLNNLQINDTIYKFDLKTNKWQALLFDKEICNENFKNLNFENNEKRMKAESFFLNNQHILIMGGNSLNNALQKNILQKEEEEENILLQNVSEKIKKEYLQLKEYFTEMENNLFEERNDLQYVNYLRKNLFENFLQQKLQKLKNKINLLEIKEINKEIKIENLEKFKNYFLQNSLQNTLQKSLKSLNNAFILKDFYKNNNNNNNFELLEKITKLYKLQFLKNNKKQNYYYDIIIKSKNRKDQFRIDSIKAHYCVLMTRSKFFTKLFKNLNEKDCKENCNENNLNEIIIENYHSDVITIFICYLYTCEFHFNLLQEKLLQNSLQPKSNNITLQNVISELTEIINFEIKNTKNNYKLQEWKNLLNLIYSYNNFIYPPLQKCHLDILKDNFINFQNDFIKLFNKIIKSINVKKNKYFTNLSLEINETLQNDEELALQNDNLDLQNTLQNYIYCHKSILTINSTHLQKVLQSGMEETTSSIIKFHENSLNGFIAILKYMYTNLFDFINLTNCIDVFVISHLFEMEELKIFTRNYIIKNISIYNAATILDISEFYSENLLQSHCLSFIVNYFVERSGKELQNFWEKLSENCLKLFKGMIENSILQKKKKNLKKENIKNKL
ncbi:hypothetical protein ABK040_014309 [Willaertia magna]